MWFTSERRTDDVDDFTFQWMLCIGGVDHYGCLQRSLTCCMKTSAQENLFEFHPSSTHYSGVLGYTQWYSVGTLREPLVQVCEVLLSIW